MNKSIVQLVAVAATAVPVVAFLLQQPRGDAGGDALLEEFRNPPAAARPRVWWHWMNGNVTEDGIAKDIDWMSRVGIGGLQNFDASLGTPQVVEKRLAFMTPEWKQAFRFAAQRAQEQGLELAIAASPGWSETGGPWVEPKDGLKKLVWSELTVEGGSSAPIVLPPLPDTTGPFQTLPAVDELAGFSGAEAKAPPTFRADVAVLAYPLNGASADSAFEASTHDGTALSSALLTDADPHTAVAMRPAGAGRTSSITLRYNAPQTLRAFTLHVLDALPLFGDALFLPVLEAREAQGWRRIAELPLTAIPTTVAFAPVTASEFRVAFGPNTAPRRVSLGEGAPGAASVNLFPNAPADAPLRIGELRPSSALRVDRFETKAGFSITRDYYALASSAAADDAGSQPAQVLNLTDRLRNDGSLDWTAPPGRWRVLRLGYSLTGKTNHPATPEATGLEVDKFDGDAVRRYLETYLSMYRETTGEDLYGKRGLRALLTDSIEVGAANWTPQLIARFRELRGYDPTSWLPTLTGALIGTRAQSDAFLYDYRRTLADLMASEHYGTVKRVAKSNGLTLYGEALEDVRPTLGDDLAMRAHADIPMAAMWSFNRDGAVRPTLLGDMKGAASVAHVYGQNLVAAESLTAANSPWAFAPSDLRRLIDLEFAWGVNRPVIHTSVHQPLDDRQPGLSLAIFGQYFNRHDTWAEMARPWVDYIARNSYLLQQGRNVADVAYFYGEEQPVTALFAFAPPADLPRRYAYDFINAEMLRTQLSVNGSELVARSGARYRVLYLGGTSQKMTLPVLTRILALVESGATVVGRAPQSSPALQDDADLFRALVARLWSGARETRFGRGRVIDNDNVEASLAAMGVSPDFTYAGAQSGAELLFVHRRLAAGDAYFITNRNNRSEAIEARFRVSGRVPEIWRADTGTTEAVSYRIEGETTIVPLQLDAEESFHVVFRRRSTARSLTVAPRSVQPLMSLDGAWSVSFQPGRGAPARIDLKALRSLSEHPDAAVRYFSGIAAYTQNFEWQGGTAVNGPVWLDLGQVGDVAEVLLNGSRVGIAWKPPYRLDVSGALKPGVNQLEVRVANLWVNRLIGDAQPDAQKIAFTTAPTYRPDAPLRASGLIGPVALRQVRSGEQR